MWDLKTLKRLNAERVEFLRRKNSEKRDIRNSSENIKPPKHRGR